jgi:hypothetical protein
MAERDADYRHVTVPRRFVDIRLASPGMVQYVPLGLLKEFGGSGSVPLAMDSGTEKKVADPDRCARTVALGQRRRSVEVPTMLFPSGRPEKSLSSLSGSRRRGTMHRHGDTDRTPVALVLEDQKLCPETGEFSTQSAFLKGNFRDALSKKAERKQLELATVRIATRGFIQRTETLDGGRS